MRFGSVFHQSIVDVALPGVPLMGVAEVLPVVPCQTTYFFGVVVATHWPEFRG